MCITAATFQLVNIILNSWVVGKRGEWDITQKEHIWSAKVTNRLNISPVNLNE